MRLRTKGRHGAGAGANGYAPERPAPEAPAGTQIQASWTRALRLDTGRGRIANCTAAAQRRALGCPAAAAQPIAGAAVSGDFIPIGPAKRFASTEIDQRHGVCDGLAVLESTPGRDARQGWGAPRVVYCHGAQRACRRGRASGHDCGEVAVSRGARLPHPGAGQCHHRAAEARAGSRVPGQPVGRSAAPYLCRAPVQRPGHSGQRGGKGAPAHAQRGYRRGRSAPSCLPACRLCSTAALARMGASPFT